MATLMKNEILIRHDLRPCIVKGAKALFHGFTRTDLLISPSPMVGGHNGGVVARTAAIVEFENGNVVLIEPTDITFCDSAGVFSEYAFRKEEINENNSSCK